MDALRFLGEAGKCRKLDSQVKFMSFGFESDHYLATRILKILVTEEMRYILLFPGRTGCVLDANGQHDERLNKQIDDN